MVKMSLRLQIAGMSLVLGVTFLLYAMFAASYLQLVSEDVFRFAIGVEFVIFAVYEMFKYNKKIEERDGRTKYKK
jgi:putative Ca2+/H+ antiporter (TMEM165/GDT1 family)